MQKINLNQLFLLFSGSTITLISLVLAYQHKFKNYYEIFLLGILLILFVFKSSRKVSLKSYMKFYIISFALGLIGDLVTGLTLFKLWIYNYNYISQYILLYIWVYPLGGIILIQSFFVFLDLLNVSFDGKKVKKFNYKEELLLFIIGILLSVIGVVLSTLNLNFVNIVLFFDSVLIVFLLLNIYSEKKKSSSVIYLLIHDPFKILLAIILATFTAAFMHEIPNIVAEQWVYTNLPFYNSILGVPIIVLGGWPILLIISLAGYFTINSTEELSNIIKD